MTVTFGPKFQNVPGAGELRVSPVRSKTTVPSMRTPSPTRPTGSLMVDPVNVTVPVPAEFHCKIPESQLLPHVSGFRCLPCFGFADQVGAVTADSFGGFVDGDGFDDGGEGGDDEVVVLAHLTGFGVVVVACPQVVELPVLVDCGDPVADLVVAGRGPLVRDGRVLVGCEPDRWVDVVGRPRPPNDLATVVDAFDEGVAGEAVVVVVDESDHDSPTSIRRGAERAVSDDGVVGSGWADAAENWRPSPRLDAVSAEPPAAT